MPAQWTGDVVGQMHQHGILKKDLAIEMGWNAKYLSQVLNGRVEPHGAEERIRQALTRLIPNEPASVDSAPMFNFVSEVKTVPVEYRDDLEAVAEALSSGEWVAVAAQRSRGTITFTLGKVRSECRTDL